MTYDVALLFILFICYVSIIFGDVTAFQWVRGRHLTHYNRKEGRENRSQDWQLTDLMVSLVEFLYDCSPFLSVV